MDKFKIVAHRGYAGKYPENTMLSMKKAAAAGLQLFELDIQLTKDHIPILLHDATLERTTSGKGSVFDYTLSELTEHAAGEVARLGEQFKDEPIVMLEHFLQWLGEDTTRHAYVEIKDESLAYFGYQTVTEAVLPLLMEAKAQVTIIAYDLDYLLSLREHGWQGVGWVLTFFNEDEKQLAIKHQPEIIICNYRKMQNSERWKGPWEWMHYEVVDAALARSLVKQGASYIETMEVEQLISGLKKEEWQ